MLRFTFRFFNHIFKTVLEPQGVFHLSPPTGEESSSLPSLTIGWLRSTSLLMGGESDNVRSGSMTF